MEKKWSGEGAVTLAGAEYPVTYEITRSIKKGAIRQTGYLTGIPKHLVNEVMNAGAEMLTLSDGRKVEVAIAGMDPREPVEIVVHGDPG